MHSPPRCARQEVASAAGGRCECVGPEGLSASLIRVLQCSSVASLGLSCRKRKNTEEQSTQAGAITTSGNGKLAPFLTPGRVRKSALRSGCADAFAAALRAAGGRPETTNTSGTHNIAVRIRISGDLRHARRRRALRMRGTSRFVSVFDPCSSVFFSGIPRFVVSREKDHRKPTIEAFSATT